MNVQTIAVTPEAIKAFYSNMQAEEKAVVDSFLGELVNELTLLMAGA